MLHRNSDCSYFKLVEPERVDEEDEVQDQVANQSGEDQRLPAVVISERTGYHDEYHPRQTLHGVKLLNSDVIKVEI